VYVQADQSFRMNPGDIRRYQVRAPDGSMVPLASLVRIAERTAPQVISHYNLFRSVEITGSAAPGFSSGQAIAAMEALSRRALPQGFSFQWSGLSLEEIKAGGQSVAIFGLGLLLVYLTLAGQYESLTLPFIIMLAVPLGILEALVAQWSAAVTTSTVRSASSCSSACRRRTASCLLNSPSSSGSAGCRSWTRRSRRRVSGCVRS
jgi:HAE1 family hydrophobic/amphiphilic exporter-1